MSRHVFNPHAQGSQSSQGSKPSQGMTTGIVTSNEDPEQRGRVRVEFPVLDGENESHWARVVTPMAGPGSGLHLRDGQAGDNAQEGLLRPQLHT